MSNHTVIKVVFVILSGFLVLYITRDFNRLGSRDERLNMFSRRSRTHNDLTIQNNSVFKSHEMNLAGDDDKGDNFDMNFKQMGNITNFGEPKEAIASLQKRHMENVLEKSQITDDAKSINILKRAKSKKNIKYMYTVGNDIMENKKEIITRLKTGVYDTEENKSKMDISSNQIASGNIGIESEKFKVAPTTNLHHFKSEPGSFKIDEKDDVKKENSKIKKDGLNGERGRKSWKFKVALARNSHNPKSELRPHKMNGKYENHTENHNIETSGVDSRTRHGSANFKVAPTAFSFSKSNSLPYKTNKGDNISNDSEIKESELNGIKTVNEFASDKFKVAPKAHSFMKSHSLPYKTNRKDSNEKRYEMDESNLNGNNELAPEKIKVAVNAHSKSNSSSYKKFNKDGNDIDDHEIEVIEDDNCPDNRERYILKKLLKKWNSIATQHGITYYFFFGSLLGYHRNGDILPWDTDVDVAVDSRDHRVLRELASPRTFKYKKHDDISRLVVREDLTFPLSRRTRVSCDGRVVERSVDGCSFQDPMARVVRGDRHIDIFAMYALNKTTIHEPTDDLTFDVSQIFPLRSCSFLGIKSKCPAKIASVLRTTYGRGFNIPSKACIDGKWTNRQDVLTLD